MPATLTTIGLYRYDESLFDGLTFPEGIEKDIAVNEILMKSGEFEVLYPNIDFFKAQIDFWGRKHYRTFDKWIKALDIDFEPLYNYDRTEEWDDELTRDNKSKTEADYNNDRTADLEDKRTLDTADTRTPDDLTSTQSQTLNGTDETKVAAYDSSDYQPKEKTTHDMGTIVTVESGTDTMTHTGTDTVATTGTDKVNTKGTLADTKVDDKEKTKHKGHIYGNIGVTTSAALLREYLDTEYWNIYEHIADLFVEEFCIMVY